MHVIKWKWASFANATLDVFFFLDAGQGNGSIDTPLVRPVKPLSCEDTAKQTNKTKQAKKQPNNQTNKNKQTNREANIHCRVISLSKCLDVLYPEGCVNFYSPVCSFSGSGKENF